MNKKTPHLIDPLDLVKKLDLGGTVTDGMTGFTGIAVGITQYLNGCISVMVQSKALKDGVPLDAQWFDIQRLVEGCQDLPGGPQQRPPARPAN